MCWQFIHRSVKHIRKGSSKEERRGGPRGGGDGEERREKGRGRERRGRPISTIAFMYII